MSSLINKNVMSSRTSGGRTSIRLEPELWDALEEIRYREGISISALIERIEKQQHAGGGRTSAVRVFIVDYLRKVAGWKMQSHEEAA